MHATSFPWAVDMAFAEVERNSPKQQSNVSNQVTSVKNWAECSVQNMEPHIFSVFLETLQFFFST